MRKFFIVLLLIGVAAGNLACKKIKGKGDVVSETRNISGFTGIGVSIDGVTYVSQDTVYGVRILAQQNVIDVIVTEVEDGKLMIRIKDHVVLGPHDAISIYVSAPVINSLSVSGSGNIEGNTPITGTDLDMIISGSGNIRVPAVTMNSVVASISGSGDISVSGGQSAIFDATISGSGNIDFLGMTAETVYAKISGSGSITTTVTGVLDGTISGSGSIRYKGNPVIYSHISGSGEIVPI